ncbi:VanZ family protein [Paenibacillus apiarius]|uniref:VanZ family protein n=1 Tax=Paenibacillus apiarius TaxID=46240 RepID=UPI001981B9CE|nr:VanZ family protein [Paenibacillus apiarius]MBN3522302.1 VanZ family protein [Paenibacillus apiarius]
MNAYLFPIKSALITFPFAAFFLTLPFLIVQYRRYGYVNKVRSLVLYSMLLYFISAFYLVILPLPAQTHNCVERSSAVFEQLRPFQFIRDIVKESRVEWSHPSTYVYLLQERAFFQAAFNMVLTLPLGVYLRYYFRRSFLQTTVIALLVSLFFEVTQRTGLYGIYDCPYRLFDVDDLLLNTLGGMTGFLLAPLITYFLPRSHELDANVDLKSKPVGFIRRAIAVWLDSIVLSIVMGCVYIVYTALVYKESMANFDLINMNPIYLAAGIFIYFIVMPLFTEGKTFGKWVTRIHLQEDRLNSEEQQRVVSFIGLVKRYGLLYFGIGGINYVFWYVLNFNEVMDSPLIMVAIFLAWLIFNGVLFIHLLLHLFKKDKRLFYEKMSGTRNVITIPERMLRDMDVMPPHSDSGNETAEQEPERSPDMASKECENEVPHLEAQEVPSASEIADAGAQQSERAEPEQLSKEEIIAQELARLKAKLGQSGSTTEGSGQDGAAHGGTQRTAGERPSDEDTGK